MDGDNILTPAATKSGFISPRGPGPKLENLVGVITFSCPGSCGIVSGFSIAPIVITFFARAFDVMIAYGLFSDGIPCGNGVMHC
jgi:hypothetical protein